MVSNLWSRINQSLARPKQRAVQVSTGWFDELWDRNYEFFNQAALNAASPDSQLDKLAEELQELREDHTAEEAADVMVCLIGFLIKSDISMWEFLEALDDKTEINLARKWTLQPEGFYRHT